MFTKGREISEGNYFVLISSNERNIGLILPKNLKCRSFMHADVLKSVCIRIVMYVHHDLLHQRRLQIFIHIPQSGPVKQKWGEWGFFPTYL